MLVDRAKIYVRAGKGGAGCMSFRREKFVPKGGPDGGNGGHGGDVVLVGDPSLDSLIGVAASPHFRAGNGRHGMGKSKHGAGGDDCEVRLPLGTLVFDADSQSAEPLHDLSELGQRVVIVHGGKGGFGNEHYKSATNQAPRQSTPGEPGEERTLRLELKLIADVGLVGKPNAGKSTMLRAISRATPKVADYPFTTMSPNLGIAELPGERRLVVADIPGLIEGASGGAGLGHDFLRHIERTRVLVHLLDVAPMDGSDPVGNYREIRRELGEYSAAMLDKPEIVVLNKIDLVPEDDRNERVAGFARHFDAAPMATSGATGDGLSSLLEACWEALGKRETTGWRSGK